jgi:2-keto-4-pentenoate hydratase/2-oxohepta-3-ene-1,7-dioic acid hydratase in catechol pathway
MVLFIGWGQFGIDAAHHAVDATARTDEAFGVRTSYWPNEVKLLSPVPRPGVLRDFLTFEDHLRGVGKALGWSEDLIEVWFEILACYKGDPDTVVGPEATVVCPPCCQNFDFELELALVIGRRGKNISAADAGRYMAGYTIWNDFSARDQQKKEGKLGMGPGKGKDFDTGNAIGPYLVTADEIDPDNLRTIARVNGEVWTDSTSAGRYHSFADLIAHVSQSETIYPGEVWGSGTVGGGSGPELGRWLKAGDVIELEIEGIGILRNRMHNRVFQ